MLETALAKLYSRTRTYLSDVLGATAAPTPMAAPAGLPYFLLDAYALAKLDLFGWPCVLLTPLSPTPSLGEAKRHAAQLAKALPDTKPEPLPVLLLDELSSFERRHLIEQGVAFMVPGNQLFIPALGVDLREYFPRRRRRGKEGWTLSPATQALFIATLLAPEFATRWRPEQEAERLGYTLMTVTRAVRELDTAGLVRTEQQGRWREVYFLAPARATWEKAQPVLRSPIRREVQVLASTPLPADAQIAGLSALAERTLLGHPGPPVWAISAESWKLAQDDGVKVLLEELPGLMSWQIWIYGPQLAQQQAKARAVDPLSLYLSLRDDPDERVQIALKELQEALPWPS